MSTGSSRRLRLALVAGMVVLLAGVTATVAHAFAFDDGDPCPVQVIDGAPVLICPSGTVGTPYSIQLKGRAGCTPYKFEVHQGSLPAGLSMTSSGLISGTPTQTVGTLSVWMRLISNCPPDAPADREFHFSVNSGLLIVTNDVPQNASIGVPYTATLQALIVTSLNPVSGAAASGATWSVVSGVGTGLPPGLALGSGVITGTPTTEGAYSFRIQASLNGASHFQTYSLNVRQPLAASGAPPLVTPPLPTVWETGLPFAAKITPSGGSGTYTMSLASGALPTGLVLGPDGTVSGTPTTPGVFRASVGLADSEGRTAEYAANFAVAHRLAVTTVALKPGKVGKRYRARVVSSGGVNPRLWKLAGGKLPKGLKFDRKLGVVSGIPKKAGGPRVTFQVTDGLRVIAKKTLRIVIAPTPKR
ncbi:MAG TPA: Ig domain-containing protein [Gaiellaceae bacterium]|jgi:hypothetical protein|nr:Ig domain-containing protein [Gaiellaceae bacterium]